MSTPRWPPEQLFGTADEVRALVDRCTPAFRATCGELRIDTDLTGLLSTHYVPLALWLMHFRALSRRSTGARSTDAGAEPSSPVIVGVTGGQGSGKSTVSALLAEVLRSGFNTRAVPLSIDDIYATHADRQALGARVHPLLATRGPPGTHDVDLGIRTLDALRTLGVSEELRIPSFDKAMDDRLPQAQWPVVSGPVDFILFEGWCVNAQPQHESALAAPLNELERDEDADGTWRRFVNDALRGPYRTLFERVDVQIMLNVGSMERVFEWRELQEQKLRERVAALPASGTTRVMSPGAIVRFIQHYERITRHLLAELPARADLVFDVDDTHNPDEVTINRPLS